MDDKPSIGSRKLAQVAICVRDIDEAISRWAELLGVPEPSVILTAPGNEVNMTYRGEPSSCKAKLAFFDLGGVQLELIEPIGQESAWYEGMDRNGEVVHHLAFWVEGMDKSKEFLESHGAAMVQRGDMGEGQYAYFDGQDRYGVMFELLEQKRTPLA